MSQMNIPRIVIKNNQEWPQEALEAAAKSLEAALPPEELIEDDVVIHIGSKQLGKVVSNGDGIVTVSISTFHISYIGGYMAWGNVIWPVSMLYKVDWHWPGDGD